MPALASDAIVYPTSALVASFKSKIKASLLLLKHRLSSITQRLDNYMANDIFKYRRSLYRLTLKHLKSVNDYMIDIIKYVGVMIDNADVYEGDDVDWIWRWTPPGQTSHRVFAHQDINRIFKAAIKCIDIIGKHTMPK